MEKLIESGRMGHREQLDWFSDMGTKKMYGMYDGEMDIGESETLEQLRGPWTILL